ncbi:MAG: CPBP family intramembrane metalloprotease [Breznakibacter sp.]
MNDLLGGQKSPYSKPSGQLVFFSLLLALGYLFAIFIMSSIVPFFPGAFGENGEVASASYLRIAQVIQFAVLMFMPVMVYMNTVAPMEDKAAFNPAADNRHYVWAILGFAVALPFIDELANINRMMELPGWLGGIQKWMQEGEATSERLIRLMLETKVHSAVLLNFAIMVVMPAVCEEFLFRGVLQQKLTQIWKNPWWAIIATGFIFSAIHFQFLTFLPRFVQGIALGYLFYASGSIWVAVAAHFANNLFALLFYYYIMFRHPELDPQKIDTTSGNMWMVVSSMVLAVYFIQKVRLAKKP